MKRGCPACGHLVIQAPDGVEEGTLLLLDPQTTTPVLASVDPHVRAIHVSQTGPAWPFDALVRLLMHRRSTTEQGARDLIEDDYEWHAPHTCPTPATDHQENS